MTTIQSCPLILFSIQLRRKSFFTFRASSWPKGPNPRNKTVGEYVEGSLTQTKHSCILSGKIFVQGNNFNLFLQEICPQVQGYTTMLSSLINPHPLLNCHPRVFKYHLNTSIFSIHLRGKSCLPSCSICRNIFTAGSSLHISCLETPILFTRQ